ncbi:MAG: translocation/assembly module TamB domain-containing protein [bacterium]|nr:translocation/assembly module TamB domain-containing protein [bacterium]
MRISIIIFMTIILSGIGVYYVWQKGIPQGFARNKIILEIEKRLNGKLEIKTVYFKFPNQIVLEGIKLHPLSLTKSPIRKFQSKIQNPKFKIPHSTPMVEIKRLICEYNLWTPIIHSGKWATGVSKIVVVDPYLSLCRDKAGNWNFSALFKPQPDPRKEPPSMPILIKNACVSIEDKIFGTQTTLSPLYLSYYPQGPPPYFHLRLGYQIKVSGNIYGVSPLQASFNLKITNKDVSDYAGFLKTQWANLLAGKVSGRLRGEIQDKNINLDSGSLAIKEGTIKLLRNEASLNKASFNKASFNKASFNKASFLKYPLTNINGNFSLSPDRNLITHNLKFKFNGIEVTTQKFDIFKQESGLIEFVTSNFYVQDFGDILPYLRSLNLKSRLKFKGEFDLKQGFSLLGEAELLNQIPTGYKFPIQAKFQYKDKTLDDINLLIAQKTRIVGKIAIPKEVHLKAKFDKSNILPLSALSGKKELKNGMLTGEFMIKKESKKIQYTGNLKLEGSSLFKEITADVKGDEKSIKIISQLIQPQGTSSQGKIDIAAKGTRENTDQPFSLSLTGVLSGAKLFNKNVCGNFTFDGKLSTKTKLAGGQFRAENIVIDHNSPLNWQGSLIYNHNEASLPNLNISTAPQNRQLTLSGKITFAEQMTTSLQIKTKDIDLGILTKELVGTFDGEFNLNQVSAGRTFPGKITISGESVNVHLADGDLFRCRSLTGNFELDKIKNTVYIKHLVLNEPQKMDITGKIDLTEPFSMDLKARVYNLEYKEMALSSQVEFTGNYQVNLLSKSQLTGTLKLSRGNINDFIIDRGKINFTYADRIFTIKESELIFGDSGVLTTSGVVNTKGSINLDFSLSRMNYQDMPYPYFKRFKGEFNLTGKAGGNIDNPIISASLKSKEVIINQEKIVKIAANINYSNGELRLIDAKINDKLTFYGTFRTRDEYLSGIVKSGGENLATLACLLSVPSKNLSGAVRGEIKAEGKLDNLGIEATVEIENLHLPGLDASRCETNFTLENKILSFQKLLFVQEPGGTMEFKKYCVQLKPDSLVALTATMNNFMICNTVFAGNIYFSGTGTPWNKVKGGLEAKNLFINQSDTFKTLTVNICYEKGVLEFLPSLKPNSLSGKIRFISNEKLEIEEIKIFKAKVEKLKINGSIGLLAKRCDVRFSMERSDLELLPLWFSEVKKAEGKVDGWLHITGSFDEPQFNGSLMVTDGELTTSVFGKKVTELQGQIRIVNNWFMSNLLTAKVGKGVLVMKSNAPWTLKDIDIELKSSHKPIPISIPGFLEGGIEIDIQIKGNITSPIGSGRINVVNAEFTYPPKTKDIGGSGRIKWENLMITADKNVRYYNEYVDVKIKRKGGWLKISTPGDEVQASGIIYAQGGGWINYLGQNFTIKRASLEFRESNFMPYLSGYATAILEKRRLALTYEGYLGEGKPVLTAFGGYPPMNEEQIVNVLLAGKTEYADLNTRDKDTILKLGFGQVVGKEIAFSVLMPIEKQIGQLLGIDVELKTQALDRMFEESIQEDVPEKVSKTSSVFEESEFKIGRFLSENLYVSYRGILKPWEEEEFARLKLKQELELEYYLSGNTSLKYKWTPEGVWRKGDEHEVMLEREVRF